MSTTGRTAKVKAARAGAVDVALRLGAIALENACAAQLAGEALEATARTDARLTKRAREKADAALASAAAAVSCVRLAQAAACAGVCIGHQGPVLRSSFNCGSRLLTTIGMDGTARVWLVAASLNRSTILEPDIVACPEKLRKLQGRVEATAPLLCTLLATAVLAAPTASLSMHGELPTLGPMPTLAHCDTWYHHNRGSVFCAASAGCSEPNADLATERARHVPQLFQLHGVEAPSSLPAFVLGMDSVFELRPNTRIAGPDGRRQRRGWRVFGGSGSDSDSEGDGTDTMPGSVGLLCTRQPQCDHHKRHEAAQVRCPHCCTLFAPPPAVLGKIRAALAKRRDALGIVAGVLLAAHATTVSSELSDGDDSTAHIGGMEEKKDEEKEEEGNEARDGAACAWLGGNTDASVVDSGRSGDLELDSICISCESKGCDGMVQLIPWLLEDPLGMDAGQQAVATQGKSAQTASRRSFIGHGIAALRKAFRSHRTPSLPRLV